MICWGGFEIWEGSLGFVIVIHRLENGRKIYVVLGCENGGEYKQYKNKLVCKSTRTKICRYPLHKWGWYKITPIET